MLNVFHNYQNCCGKILDLDISGSMTCTDRLGQYLILDKINLVQRLTPCISSLIPFLLLFILRGRRETNK